MSTDSIISAQIQIYLVAWFDSEYLKNTGAGPLNCGMHKISESLILYTFQHFPFQYSFRSFSDLSFAQDDKQPTNKSNAEIVEKHIFSIIEY